MKDLQRDILVSCITDLKSAKAVLKKLKDNMGYPWATTHVYLSSDLFERIYQERCEECHWEQADRCVMFAVGPSLIVCRLQTIILG